MKRFALLLPLLLLASTACSRPCPKRPEPVVTHSLTRSPTCNLRALPSGVSLTNVGFPTPDTIVVSRTDFAEMIAFVTELRDWALDARACLEAGR
jgi:hypothetical protein